MIIPERTELTEPFWQAAEDGVLLLQECRVCRHVWHPPAPVCPRCRTDEPGWIASAGTGRLYSYTRVEHAAHAAIAVPYLVALVELDEGPRVVCTLLGDEAGLGPATRIRLSLGPAGGGLMLPVARPVRPAAGGPGRPA